MSIDDDRAGWRVDEWLRAAGYPFSRNTLYTEIARGNIDARRAARNTVILTSPRAYLDSRPPIPRGTRFGR
jgi:hypothetical protein